MSTADRFRTVTTFALLTVVVCATEGDAATKAQPTATTGQQQYIVMLKPAYLFAQPNASAATPISEIQIGKLGGTVDFKEFDRFVVTIPEAAVQALRRFVNVKYLQKVLLGPPRGTQTATPLRAETRARRAEPLGTQTWSSGDYVYDSAGNIVKIGTDSYLYDTAQRLASSTTRGHNETYSYDAFGNLTQKVPADVATNHLQQSYGYYYDQAGNLKQSGTEAYAYDPFNMMREKDYYESGYRQELYVYTPNDERIGVKNGDRWYWSIRGPDGKVLRQYQSSAAFPTEPWLWLEDYVYRDGLLLGGERVPEEGGRRQFHLDHLGTPRLITGTNGLQISAHDYYPFGNQVLGELHQETANGFDREDPMKFTGHERDFTGGTSSENTDYLDDMHARYYTPLGRFLSVDPGRWNPKRPQSFNRYSYALNNPVRYFDPDGQEPLDPTIRTFLEHWYSADFSRVQVYGGFFAHLLANRNLAITFGNRIFFSAEGWQYYKSVHNPTATAESARTGVAIPGHEVTHTLQAAPMGVFSFVLSYLHQWASVGFDYNKIPYEIQAYSNEEAIRNYLLQHPEVLDAIRDGSYSTVTYHPDTSGWTTITSLSNSPFGGLYALYNFNGVLFIDGVNLTGVFNVSPRK